MVMVGSPGLIRSTYRFSGVDVSLHHRSVNLEFLLLLICLCMTLRTSRCLPADLNARPCRSSLPGSR